MAKKNLWKSYDEKNLAKLNEVAEGYKKFISEGKTERLCVQISEEAAKKAGFKDLQENIDGNIPLKEGDKFYTSFMGKTMLLGIKGKEPLEKGANILGAHIDSPRMDLKQNPVFENTNVAYFDTHYYGGIKKYQWVTLPLALYGVIVKKDGTVIDVAIGDKEDDPVFCISDLLIHLAAKQMDKKASVVIEGEDLNVIVGNMPLKDEEEEAVKKNVLKILMDQYGVEEDDFLSAEIEVVPAGKARDLGLDRSMIIGYGQDDRVCAYTSLLAILELDQVPERTSLCLLVDKEEIGSVGATGMHSKFFENTLAEILNLEGNYSDILLRRAIVNSYMLSSDVSAALDPTYASAFEKNNAAEFGNGIVFNKYTGARGKSGSNDANAEYMAKIRNVLDGDGVGFQTAELGKVDEGGGGTIAYIMGNYGMNVIDSGVALLSMHAPWEIASKADVYEAYRCYQSFLKKIK